MRELDYFKDLSGLTLPTLYLYDSEHKGAPPEEMQEMARLTPGSKYIEIPNPGKVATINRPEAFKSSLAEFLQI